MAQALQHADTASGADTMPVATELEAECFRLHGRSESDWRNKFKVLRTSLQESNTLRQAILGGDLKAADAAAMDADKLLAY